MRIPTGTIICFMTALNNPYNGIIRRFYRDKQGEICIDIYRSGAKLIIPLRTSAAGFMRIADILCPSAFGFR